MRLFKRECEMKKYILVVKKNCSNTIGDYLRRKEFKFKTINCKIKTHSFTKTLIPETDNEELKRIILHNSEIRTKGLPHLYIDSTNYPFVVHGDVNERNLNLIMEMYK